MSSRHSPTFFLHRSLSAELWLRIDSRAMKFEAKQRISGTVDDATTEYRVELRVWFVLRERMHG